MLPRVEDLESLHLQVVADPHDNAVRSAYADAVEDSDPDRAELIRLQLQMAADRLRGAESPGLPSRAGRLMAENHPRWAADVSEIVSGYSFLRGFVDVVVMDAEWFLESADEVYARAPVLHLDLTDVAIAADELFQSPSLDRIVSLELMHNQLTDEHVAALAASPHLRNLEWLSLRNNQLTLAGVETLAASPNLPRLGFVWLLANDLDDPTPQHCDEYDATSLVAEELQRKYGRREWLEAYPRWRWPPDRDATYPTY